MDNWTLGQHMCDASTLAITWNIWDYLKHLYKTISNPGSCSADVDIAGQGECSLETSGCTYCYDFTVRENEIGEWKAN